MTPRECVMCGARLPVGEKHRNVADCLHAIRIRLDEVHGVMRFLAWLKGRTR